METTVTETRQSPSGARRRRKCLACGYRVTTLEAIVAADRPHHGDVVLVQRRDLMALRAIVESMVPSGRSELTEEDRPPPASEAVS
jgi:transcriptional regulator NrdR family protein